MLLRINLCTRPPNVQRRISRLLRGSDTVVATPRKGEDFWARVARETFDLVVIDEEGPVSADWKTISAIRQLPEEPDVIVTVKKEDAGARAALLAAGAVAVVNTQLPDEALAEALRAIVERRRQVALQRRRAQDANPEHRLGDFVSSSPAMRGLMDLARRVARSDTTLLILGETGVGKEWLARAIHEEGLRAGGPFTAINCSAIVETLLESELFGHEEGAFTGARRAHRGHFELAHGGTIFLDEIAEMPTHLQAKILRVLQERKIQRVGSEKEIAVNVRVMAATSRDMEREINEQRFRSDLYYRIGVVTLAVPPLRERREDIPDLVQNYLEIFQARLGRRLRGIEDAAVKALVSYSWPGNVRELINVIERVVLLCDGPMITITDLPVAIAGTLAHGLVGNLPVAAADNPPGNAWTGKRWCDVRRQVITATERSYLTALLEATGGRIGIAAKRAGMTPRAMSMKMRHHGLRKEDFREDRED